jgi:hypothetical protein
VFLLRNLRNVRTGRRTRSYPSRHRESCEAVRREIVVCETPAAVWETMEPCGYEERCCGLIEKCFRHSFSAHPEFHDSELQLQADPPFPCSARGLAAKAKPELGAGYLLTEWRGEQFE